jgi:ABC-type transporter Mla subunit MlaD
MRRILGTLLVLAAAGAVLVFGTGTDDDGGAYEVRAMFDNGAFLVPGEEVRIAGANVGTVSAVDVTMPDEPVRADGAPEPGKAAITLRIEDPAFQDFREDASCLIRPQSLLGEKFVECVPTQPRAAGSQPPPELEVIPEGEVGAGERFLPLENNGKAVDLDLVNNIMREPYPDRFRLIINDLGAGLAARGEELAEVVDRANPALRETNEVLAILARQNRALANLARDADTVLTPLASERERVTSFVNNAETTASATAERSADLERNLELLPATLREVRATMGELERFSDAGTPVFSDLADAAPATVRATEALGPFTRSATTALTSLGDAAEASEGPLVASDPVIQEIRSVANSGKPAATNTHRLLRSLDRKDGFRNVLRFVYRGAGSFNAFDNLGHIARAFLLITNCNDYVSAPQTGCIANFLPPTDTESSSAKGKRKRGHDNKRRRDGRSSALEIEPGATEPAPESPNVVPETGEAQPVPEAETEPETTTPTTPVPTVPESPATPGEESTAPDPASASEPARMRDVAVLLDFLVGDGEGKADRGRRGKARR